MKYWAWTVLGISLPLLLTSPAMSESAHHADLINAKGKTIGVVDLTETPNGVLLNVEARQLTPGWHAIHIHQAGVCNPPDFKSAKGHFNPDGHTHGFESATGAHAGDLPNVYVAEDGLLHAQIFDPSVSLDNSPHGLLGEGGTAIVIHEKADDYKTNPTGDAGGRAACGVIQ